MSGLFTGALLAKNGYKVTVLEKNHIIGGGLQSFRRGDAVFNTGMQAFVGYKEGSIVYQLINNYLKLQPLNILPTDVNAQEIVWTDSRHTYYLPKGKKRFEEYLIHQFPIEKEGIIKIIECIYEIGNSYDYINCRGITLHKELVKYTSLTAERLLKTYIKDEQLLFLFGYIGINVGKSLSTMSAIEFGMMCNLYIEGSYRFVGGNLEFANLLRNYIEQYEGKVLNDSEVCKIDISQNKIYAIKTKDGNIYESDIVVNSVSPLNIYKWTTTEIFRKSTSYRVKEYVNNFTGYAIYLDIDNYCFPFINSAIFLPFKSKDKCLPQYAYILTPPHINQDIWAKTMEILVPMKDNEFEKWEDSYIEQRGEEYINLKNTFANRIITYISSFYPQLKNAIKNIYTATGLTVRDYYYNPKGAVYGQQGLFVPVKTKINNLYITGQAVQFQGLCGTAVAAVLTTETILGRSLIEEIAVAK